MLGMLGDDTCEPGSGGGGGGGGGVLSHTL